MRRTQWLPSTQIAAGDEWLRVSDVSLPTKRAYAAAHGYRVVEYVFDDVDGLPQCCADSDSFACTVGNVKYKYCSLRDANRRLLFTFFIFNGMRTTSTH